MGVRISCLGAVGLGREAIGVKGEGADLEVCHWRGVLGAGVRAVIVGRRGGELRRSRGTLRRCLWLL